MVRRLIASKSTDGSSGLRQCIRLPVEASKLCHAAVVTALKSRIHACLFSILFRDLTALSLH